MGNKEGHTIKDMARELDVSYVTVLNMIDRDQIKAIRMGGRWIIPAQERRRFLKEGNHPDSKDTSNNTQSPSDGDDESVEEREEENNSKEDDVDDES